MKTASKDYLIKTVYRTNTLPVISECNTSCIFCSHKQNPEGVEAFRMPKMSLEDFREVIDFLSADRKIVVGESATRIVEGEPFLYKDILPLLSMVRNKFRNSTIQVTTNGTLLNQQIVRYLKDLNNIELNISLNCVDPVKRKMVLGRNVFGDIKEKIQLLKGNIAFSGSCVMVPGIIDFADLKEIIELLDENGAQTVRVFLPGYSKGAGQAIDLRLIHDETLEYINKLRDEFALPIILEPCFMNDLKCRVEGVISNSPAAYAGLTHGDIITGINGEMAISRVDAFDRVYRLKNPELTINRKGTEVTVSLLKERNSSPGFVVLFDIAPETGKQLQKVVSRHKAKKVLIITSELAFAAVSEFLGNCRFDFSYDLACAKNSFFGGTIKCAGLLTAQDIIEYAKSLWENDRKPDLIILPPVMFDYEKRDLLGVSIKEIEKELGISVDII